MAEYKKVGFIGLGNMGSAIAQGILKNGLYSGNDILGTDVSKEARGRAEKQLGIQVLESNNAVAQQSDILFLAVKPQYYEEVITGIREAVTDEKIVVTIAPGKTLAWVTEKFGHPVHLVRTMPNTPAMVLEGATAVCPSSRITEEELAAVMKILTCFSKAYVIPENLMDTACGINGSMPAAVFIFLEAMADAAVAEGMPRKLAYELAAQTVAGSAKLMLASGKHPGALKDMVTSPAGTTIEAVRVLEEKGFRAAVMDAAIAAIEKSRKL